MEENSTQFPKLDTARLTLSEIFDNDADELFKLFSNHSVIKYYDLDAFSSIDQARKLINLLQSRFDSSAGIRWGIRLKDSNDFIGTCGFNSWNNKMQNGVIGYDLMPEYWGNGFASEAVRAIIRAAFSGLLACGPLHRIQADTVPGNLASEKLLIKLGFKEEGLRREAGFWKNAYHDLKCYGLLAREFSE